MNHSFIPFLLILILNILFLNRPSVDAADMYEYHVYGQLFCEGKPWANQDVELYDLDCWSPDDLLATGKTDAKGDLSCAAKRKRAGALTPGIPNTPSRHPTFTPRKDV
jgi:hypothetical protein